MTMSFSVPATSSTMSRSWTAFWPGLIRNSPPFQPIFTAPTGVEKGMVEEISAADAPMIPKAS